jgi:hypothetical protein
LALQGAQRQTVIPAKLVSNLSLCDQMKLKVFGKALWEHGFWDLMYRVLSNEG